MEGESNKKSIQMPEVIVVACLIIIVMCTALFVATRVDINTKANQLVTLRSISEKITVNMKDYFDTQWIALDVADRYTQYVNLTTVEDTLINLNAAKAFCGLQNSENILFLIDSKGYYYTVKSGKGSLWNRSDRLKESRAIFITSMAEFKDNIEEYICFCKKLDQPITTQEGVQFTHIILAADERAFDIDLSLSEFGHITDAFVMRSNGRKINSQTENTDLAKAYNLVDALAGARYLMGDSYEETKERIAAGKSAAALLEYKGDTYSMALHPMGVEDWYAVFIVNSKDMLSDVKPLLCRLICIMAASAAVMIVLVVALLMIMRKQEQKRERIMQDRLRDAALAADKANQAKSVFLSRMSHDIRTPINGIIGMTAIAESKIEDRASVESCLRKISVASDHLLELVNEVLDISRIESGKVVLENAPLDLRDMLNSISDILEGRLTAKDLLYRTDFQDISAPCIEGCENLLKQILINILGNAIKYTDDGGMVIFKVYNERPEQNIARYHFIVKDTGIGISSEYVQHIFDRFSQEELSARSNYEGTGLGLSIVKELTDLMGGEVLVSSKVGVGSVFEVIIPFVLSDIKESIKQQSDSISDSTVTRKLHVLLAEDNDTNREVAEFFLTKAGAVCVSVENGQLALDAFKRSSPGEYDAILLDVMMPELDGLETAQAIRALDRPDAQTIPMIAMSANAYAEDVEKSLTAGMNAHLTKPIRFDTVIETIQEFCQ